MKVYRRIISILIVISMICMAGCAQQTQQHEPAPASKAPVQTQALQKGGPETIKIGVIYALSGGAAEDGKNQRSGHELAVEEINNAGGIASMGGAKIELVFADHQASPELGMSEAERLIKEENVSMIMGCFESDVSIPVAKVCERNKVVFYSPQSVGDALTDSGLTYTFRQCPKASWWARDQLKFLQYANATFGDKVKDIGILYGDSVFGQSIAAGWKKYAPELGFNIVSDISYPVGVSSLSEPIIKMKTDGVEVVLVLGDLAESTLLIKAAQEYDYEPKAFVGMGGGFTNPSFITNLGKLSNYIFALNDWIPTVKREGAAEANKRYKDKYGKDMMGNAESTYVAFTYWMQRSKMGYYFMALRDNEEASEAIGVNAYRYKMLATVISAFFTGLGATFYVQYVGYLTPINAFDMMTVSIQFILLTVIGGRGYLLGPLLGAFILRPLSELFRVLFGSGTAGLHLLIYGVALVLVVLLLPHGLMPVIERTCSWIWRKLKPAKGGR